jgi:hypothetical protein
MEMKRVTIEGKIIAIKAMPPPLPKRPVVMKMMLLLPGNQRTWTTIPKNLLKIDGYRLKYSTIRLNVDMDPSDPNFQFLRNPRGARVVKFYEKGDKYKKVEKINPDRHLDAYARALGLEAAA